MLVSSACGGVKGVICRLKKALYYFSNPEGHLQLPPGPAEE